MTIKTYTRANRDGLIEHHGIDGLLIDFLLRFAAYDMQDASISVDWHEKRFTVMQKPHYGAERVFTGEWPLQQEIVHWIEAEQTRTSKFEVFDLDSRAVEELFNVCSGGEITIKREEA